MVAGASWNSVNESVNSAITEIAKIMAAQTEAKHFEDQIEAALKQHRLPYQRDPHFGSVQPDFLVRTPNGKQFVIEAKTWADSEPNRQIAARQVNLLKEATGADGALVVTRHFAGPLPTGVLSLHDLSKTLVGWAKQKNDLEVKGSSTPSQKTGQVPAPPPRSAGKKFIFAAMPFAPEFEDTFLAAMVPAAKTLGMECHRVDFEHFNGDIVEHIRMKIRGSTAVIADLSHAKPNVLYEAGFAHALGKPTIHVSSTALTDLPFDVRNWNTLAYKAGQTTKLKAPLRKQLRAALA